MRAIFLHIFLTALRDKIFLTLSIAMAAIIFASTFLGDQSLIEHKETSLVFAGFAIRLLLVFGIGLFTIVAVRRSFDQGEALLQLSRPISRINFIIAYFGGFWAISILLIALSSAMVLLFIAPSINLLGWWSLALIAETGLVIAFSLFAVLGLETVVGAFTLTMAFYLLTRLVGILVSLANSEFRTRRSLFDLALDYGCRSLGLLLPRLDKFTSDWLIHPHSVSITLTFTLQILAYSLLLLSASMFDLERKRF